MTTLKGNNMFAIFALQNGHFQMATFETFYTIEESLNKVREFQLEADPSVRFFIECTNDQINSNQ